MQFDFYYEGLMNEENRNEIRFTFIGIQIGKNKDMPAYLTIWLLGLGLRILF